MKLQTLSLSLAMIAGLTLSSCSKNGEDDPNSYTCAACVKTPEALAVNDQISKGIYKGVLVASSGTVKFDLANSGNTITAVVIINGSTINLTSNVAWMNGQPFIGNFMGTHNGQPVSITFSVSADGTNPSVTGANIPGHNNPVLTVVKETSQALVECFEGTYSLNTGKRGTYNIMVARSARIWGGVSREQGTTSSNSLKGTVDATGKMIDNTNLQVGQLTGDVISGTFARGNEMLTVAGRRTL